MSNIFPTDFEEKNTIANNDFILFSDSEDWNKLKKAQYSNLKWEKWDTWNPWAAATISVWTTTTGDAWTSATVTNSGTSSAAVLNFTIPKWAKWDEWNAATITVWTTTTWAAWTNATVTNSGTSSAAVLNFTIPRWADWTGSWDVSWPASSTDWNIATFDWATGKLIEDSGVNISDLNTKEFTLSSTSDLTNAQDAYDWYLAGKYPVIKYSSKFYYPYSMGSTNAFWAVPFDKTADSSGTTWLYRDWINMTLSSWTITTMATTTIFVANSNFLRTGVNYPTPYTPEYNGSPATKKYVDDSASTKQDTLVSGTNIKTVNNQSLLWSWDITISWWWSDIEYVTSAEYTALLPWAESDGKHYFIYTSSAIVPRTPWTHTVLYYSFDEDTASTAYDWVGNYNATWNSDSWTYASVNYGKCAIVDWTNGAYLSVPTSFTFPTTDFTISFWINFTQYVDPDLSINPAIFSKWNGSGSTNAYLYINNNAGKIWVDIPYVVSLFSSDNQINDGNWHLVVVTKSWNNYSLYIDLLSAKTNSNSASLHWWSSTQALIWRNNNTSETTWFDWKIDEFIVENVAWSAQDVASYYNQTKAYFGIS